MPYCELIPEENQNVKLTGTLGVKYFGEAKDFTDETDCYDRTIRYIDDNLKTIFSKAKTLSDPTAILVLSDHGEAPEFGTRHNSELHSANQIEVPHFWWFNASAQTLLADKIKNLDEHLTSPFNTDHIYSTVMDLYGVDPALYRPNFSLFSPTFKEDPRVTLNSYINYDDPFGPMNEGKTDYRERVRANLLKLKTEHPEAWEKVWAHRCDTIGKMMEAKHYFAGVEFDVVFKPELNRFHIYHEPAADMGLDLEEYLDAAKDKPKLKFWFDWKNANAKEFAASFAELKRLDQKFKIKDRILIETGPDHIFDALAALDQEGFKHSYYLPTTPIKKCTQPCTKEKEGILEAVKRVGANGISYDADVMPFVQSKLTSLKALKHYTWSLNTDATNPQFQEIALKALGNHDVLLVVFPSVFYW